MSRDIAMVALGLGLAGCGALTFLGAAEKQDEIPRDVQAAFDNSCASSDCHGSPFPPADLDLTAANSASILGRASAELPELPLVEIGNLQGSYLALKLLPEAHRGGVAIEGERMPLDGEQDSADVALILGWIGGAELASGTPAPTTTPTETTTSPTGVPAEVNDCSAWGATLNTVSLVEYGEGPGMIPTVPGHIIEGNCGCHTVPPDELQPWVLEPPDNGFRVNTLADWQVDIFGVPAIDIAKSRVELHDMPQPIQCGIRSSGGAMTAGDYAVLLAWLEAGAPDAPAWNALQP